VPHHYLFQRPRALQYTYRGERIGYGEDAAPIQHQISGASDIKYTAEGVAKARERIDLFIDLVWVGIISNLSEVFSVVFFEAEADSGKAFLMFVLVFLPAWRIWNFLREFLNSFYMDDTIQRVFIFWILALSVFFGNEIAYFAEEYESIKQNLIVTYITIRASFVVMELFYSFWIPWMRRLLFMGFLIMLPASGLWIGAIFAEGAHAIGPALAAILWEYAVPLILDTPLGEKLLPSEYRKEVDPIHLRGRMGNFLIITIGEGVLMLVRGGPLGSGFTTATSLGSWSLLIYFVLAFLYFQRDGSVRFIPAVRHKGWRMMIWIL
jgi:low temperature requirement protein LtrA